MDFNKWLHYVMLWITVVVGEVFLYIQLSPLITSMDAEWMYGGHLLVSGYATLLILAMLWWPMAIAYFNKK